MSGKIRPINRDYHLPGSIEQVWLCLSDSDECSLWQGQECEIGEKEGDPITLFGGWVTGNVLKIKEKELLSYTWDSSDWPSGTRSSIVNYKLTKIDDETTLVTLSHDLFPNQTERDNHDKGWDEHFFGPMRTYLQQVND